jgi:hypothetical protein
MEESIQWIDTLVKRSGSLSNRGLNFLVPDNAGSHKDMWDHMLELKKALVTGMNR